MNRENVWPVLMRDILERVNIGHNRYGTLLQSHNGRDPLVDLYEELIDALQYLKQLSMEREYEKEQMEKLFSLVTDMVLCEERTEALKIIKDIQGETT